MFVKYENNEIVSLFVGCIPSEIDGYVEIPDDETIIAEYIEKNRKPAAPEATTEDRVAALEDKLVAYEVAYKQGVNEA